MNKTYANKSGRMLESLGKIVSYRLQNLQKDVKNKPRKTNHISKNFLNMI